MQLRPRLPLLLAAPMFAVLALSACVPSLPPLNSANPNPPPPAVLHEEVPLPPVSEEPLLWQPGHWNWEGQGYVWVQGQWIARAGRGTSWQDGYWSQANGTWSWVPAHWL